MNPQGAFPRAAKAVLLLVLAFCLGVTVEAQAPVAQDDSQLLSADELDQLLGPIALYPDSLIALILPASTVPSDIALAANYLANNGDPAQIANQPWDDSVKALTQYPSLLQWLYQNLPWTTQVGDAFLAQPADVMDAIQQLRAEAMAAGNLTTTPQQQVAVDDGNIGIESADPNAIYQPIYDPNEVYDNEYTPGYGPLITFGPAWPVGWWLNYGFDWAHHHVYMGDWHSAHHWGHANLSAGGVPNAHPWQPNAARIQAAPPHPGYHARAFTPPKPMPGVTIPHGVRSPNNLQNVYRTVEHNYAGRAPAVQNAPIGAPNTPAPSYLNQYQRGADARAASVRGQESRYSNPAPAAPMVEHYAPPIQRTATPPQRPITPQGPPPSAFHVSAGPSTNASSARGAQSRGGRW